MKNIDQYPNCLLRRIQGLPDNAASETVYILSGHLPIEAILHKKILGIAGGIARLPLQHNLRQLALRQLACKDPKSRSWFCQAVRIGSRYGVCIPSLFRNPWPKLAWKKHVQLLVKELWSNEISTSARTKSTLNMLLWEEDWAGKTHPIWRTCRGKPFQVQAATVRAKMLVGRYATQALQAVYKPGSPTTCPLCEKEEEDIVHLIAKCTNTKILRNPKLDNLKRLYIEDDKTPPVTDEEITSAVLNGSMFRRTPLSITEESRQTVNLSEGAAIPANQLCNLLCSQIHKHRDVHLNTILMEQAE